MRSIFTQLLWVPLLIVLPAHGSEPDKTREPTAALPFGFEIEPVMMPHTPHLQSVAPAQAGGKWLLVCGRARGLHQFTSSDPSQGTPPKNAFPASEQNGRIYTVDPAAKTVKSASLESLPASLADPLGATSVQSVQRGNRLYVIGGYGRDSATGTITTFSTVTSIDVPGLINAVLKDGDLKPHIEQVPLQQTVMTGGVAQTKTFHVTGGGLERIGDDFYLVFGQDFRGLYSVDPGDFGRWPVSQQYSERIFVLSIADNPLKVTIKSILNADPNDATKPYHRRDLNVVPTLSPTGAPSITAYGGVFVPGQAVAYRAPITISGPAATNVAVDTTFAQALSQYDCATAAMFDSTSGSLYTTFFGGISLYYFDTKTRRMRADTGLPFIKDISTIVRDNGGKSVQLVMPTTLPTFLGAEMRFLPDPSVPHAENGVLLFDKLGPKTSIGYLYGGIESKAAQTEGDPTKSSASNRVFRVWIVKKKTDCIVAPTQP